MSDARTLALYDAQAADYAAMVAQEAPDAHLRDFIALIPTGGRVLDLGCGPAQASAFMRAAGLVPDPVDGAAGMVALANETYAIRARVLTFDAIDMVAAYDGIWANFSLLHAPRADLPRHLGALARAAKPGAVLHIGMKLGTGAARDAKDRFYTYVTAAELRGLVAEAGFDITYEDQSEGAGFAGGIDRFIILRGCRDG